VSCCSDLDLINVAKLSAACQQLSPSLAWHRLFSQQQRLTFCADRSDIEVRLRNVRFGSLADICAATSDVLYTPNSDRQSGLPRQAMSALLLKAEVCGALADVCYGPIADIGQLSHGAVRGK